MKKFFAEIEDNFCGLLLFVMAILTCINVFARYILHSSMPFDRGVDLCRSGDHQRGWCGYSCKERRTSGTDIIYRYDAEEGSDCLSDRW